MRQMTVVAIASGMLLCASATWSLADSGQDGLASLRREVEDVRARLQELEARLQAVQESNEETKREVQSVGEAQGKLVQGEKLKLSGYVQVQYSTDNATDPQSDFRVRRARLKVDAPVSPLAALTLQVDAARSVELKDAYIDLGRATDVWRFRIGQAKMPFMYEVLESSSTRLEPERTALAGVLFPGERDVGAWVHFKNVLGDGIPGTTLDLGAMSGNGPSAADNNDNKSIVARLGFVLGNTMPDKNTEANTCYVALLTGKYTDSKAGVTTDRTAMGAGVSYATGPVWLRGEYVTGENRGKDISGWYAHVAYQLPIPPGTIFARYEVYDESKEAPNCRFTNLTVGYQHELDSKTRVVLAHERRHPEVGYSKFSGTDGAVTTLRFQVKY